ncbi:MAG: ribose-phosphate diphosphokinase [Pseudodesulfovibrio sp.]|jgi:ribose-phosphate pyrophosphokinase|uniref:Ribose-phosphate pyrophosphokinase n=1 Tax=Pseudodesulfovibrio indicus TaxID=1716143 RepID=A0A126QR06_9BACT|nr:ribose-phosphate pyrophosphokinase [Pseudodesulfovibrio indicus]AMK12480.1 phosphoribosylpyrophosphate synthetase [Pseudodesulfovibrio indicus]TDT90786.1 ribose-phosphate pyrophosphokinase [Pseudodesulfovibrio indicus]
MHGELKIISGSASPQLADAICEHLGTKASPVLRERFSDGEIRIEIGENVRGDDVFVVQPTCSPVNFHLMELCLMLDALKRASASRVTAVVPYFGYARQDRKVVPRAPISAKLVADLLSTAGMQRLVTIDLHAGQIQGFFNCPVDNLFAAPVLIEQLRDRDDDFVIISPDAGGVERARAYAKRLGATLAIVDKRRDAPNQAKAMHIIGDVKDKVAVVIDDMIDTAGTMCAAANVIMENGAKDVLACATHPVLSGPACQRLEQSAFSEVVVTDTIPLGDKQDQCSKLKQRSVASLLAKAINNVHTESSVSVLFV